jgi:hypothetical protein
MVNLLILESNDGGSFDELAEDNAAATLSFVAALRSFILSIVMELAVECRGNVVGNLFFIRREFQQCNQFLFSPLSRVFAKQEHDAVATRIQLRGAGVLFEQHFLNCYIFQLIFNMERRPLPPQLGPPPGPTNTTTQKTG